MDFHSLFVAVVALAPKVAPVVAWTVLGFAALDDAEDVALAVKAKGRKVKWSDITSVVANDFGTKVAVSLGGVALLAALSATGDVKQAAFYAIAGAAATALPALRGDVFTKAQKLFSKA